MRHKKTTLVTVWQQDKTQPRDKRGNYPTVVFTTYVRWESRSSAYFGSDGREYRSDNQLGVDDQLFIDDYVMKGDHSASPNPVSGSLTVKDVRESPSWNGKKLDRWVLL